MAVPVGEFAEMIGDQPGAEALRRTDPQPPAYLLATRLIAATEDRVGLALDRRDPRHEPPARLGQDMACTPLDEQGLAAQFLFEPADSPPDRGRVDVELARGAREQAGTGQ